MLPISKLPQMCLAFAIAAGGWSRAADEPKTERQYLSGHGPKDAVPWNFECTGGRRAGEKTTIPVPSNWEQHGFGKYNYGSENTKSDEHGLYQTHFTIPESWTDRRIRLVFNGVMTEASVKVNGKSAGPTHVGAFYQFRYDITSLLIPGDNRLEVDVAKVASNAQTESAEKGGDYWVFGGIFRPVWIEAVPERWIEHTAIDARADGNLTADLTLNAFEAKRPEGPHLVPERIEAQVLGADQKAIGSPFVQPIPAGGTGKMRIATKIDSPQLWTAETPNLYTLRISRMRGEETLHTVTQRFGFRTFEVRDGQGLFLNGQRILLKGVNRHSFRAQTGRALNPEDCYEDARFIKSMNMNAVRMSHYPPDEAFLEACDELGLYVLDELSGWQYSHGTEIGRRLVREMVERDVNHPSILFWDNGNEGGFNRDLDGEYAFYDPQNRRVLHPWDTFGGVDTKHYPIFKDLTWRLKGPNLVMPTEFLHALYDGGGGAGLEDYWKAISESPFGAGAFFWDLADEGIARTDQNGRIDVFSTYAPDGLVGPNHEKEASYFTIRDVWSPVQIDPPVMDEKFDGTLAVTNHYDFTELDQCKFAWKLAKFPDQNANKTTTIFMAEGNANPTKTPPHSHGKLSLFLPPNWQDADALTITANGPDGQAIWTWTWPIPASKTPEPTGSAVAKVETTGSEVSLTAGNISAKFDPSSGRLIEFGRAGKTLALTNGPALTFAKPAEAGPVEWLTFTNPDPSETTHRLAAPHTANVIEAELDFRSNIAYANLKIEISPDGQKWKTLFDNSRRSRDGTQYVFPPQQVMAVRLTNATDPDGRSVSIKSFRLGHTPARFPAETTSVPKVSTGMENGTAWVESSGTSGLDYFRWTLTTHGELQLDYRYTLNGDFLYHGITFDHPEGQMKSLRRLGEGPNRVWQNRLRGTSLGVHETARTEHNSGKSWSYPEFQGCFAGLRWARLDTDAGPFTITSASPDLYLRTGTPKIDHSNTTVEFPAGDLTFLHAIPAIGTKFSTPEASGPHGHPAKATGEYKGTLSFSFDD
jgi:hypothetical protein